MVSWKVTVAVLAVLLYVGSQIMQHYMSAGFYVPGGLEEEALAELVDLQPPEQPADYDSLAASGTWLVEQDIKIHYSRLDSGGGQVRKDVAVLVLHGGPGYPFESYEIADGVVESFENMAVFAYHQRGCGLSDRPVDELDTTLNVYENLLRLHTEVGLPAQLVDIERIRRILGVERLVLVGHSFGAFLATMYAVEFPRHTSAVVAVAPADVLAFPAPDDGLIGAVGRHFQANDDEERLQEFWEFIQAYFNLNALLTKSEDGMRLMNLQLAAYITPVMTAEHPELHFGKPHEQWAGGWMAIGMYIGLGSKHDYSQEVADLDVPLLVLHGEFDVQSEERSATYATPPEARMVTVPSAGHSIFLDNPSVFHENVVAFLRSIEL